MKDTKSLPFITTVFFISLLVLLVFSEDKSVLIYSISIGLSVLVFPFLKTFLAFLILITQILIVGFYNTLDAYNIVSSNANQLHVISEYTLYSICLATLWLTFHILRFLKEEQNALKGALEQLKKYETSVHIFTRIEFLSIARFIVTAMKRRNENGYLLTLKINPENSHIRDSVFHSLAITILESIRVDYDLVGKLTDDSIAILVQNTNNDGVEMVIQRINDNIGRTLEVDKQLFTIEIEEINDKVYENLVVAEVSS